MKKESRFKNFLKSFYASNEELAADELTEQAENRGSTLIEEIERDRKSTRLNSSHT